MPDPCDTDGSLSGAQEIRQVLRLGIVLHNGGMGLRIREATAGDWSDIWRIVREVVAGDTFAYAPEMTENEAREIWMVAAPGRTTIAVDGVAVLGTANMYANRAVPGAHVASASFMVASAARGRGVGRALVEDALTGPARQGSDRCSSTRSLRRMRRRSSCIARSGSRLPGRFPRRSITPRMASSGSTSCI